MRGFQAGDENAKDWCPGKRQQIAEKKRPFGRRGSGESRPADRVCVQLPAGARTAGGTKITAEHTRKGQQERNSAGQRHKNTRRKTAVSKNRRNGGSNRVEERRRVAICGPSRWRRGRRRMRARGPAVAAAKRPENHLAEPDPSRVRRFVRQRQLLGSRVGGGQGCRRRPKRPRVGGRGAGRRRSTWKGRGAQRQDGQKREACPQPACGLRRRGDWAVGEPSARQASNGIGRAAEREGGWRAAERPGGMYRKRGAGGVVKNALQKKERRACG